MLETALSGHVKHNVLKSINRIFTELAPVMYYGTEMIALNLGVTRSKFKVTEE